MNRKELFINWYAWSLKYKDCDPAVWCTNYLNKRFEHNDEQKLWFAWLYGNTYYLPTAWILMNEFPDFELATFDRIENWNSLNYKRLRYQTDTKWNKGHLPSMFNSYKEFIGKGLQRDKLESFCGDNEYQNFDNIWEAIKTTLYKFGRYSTWFYMQHLKHTCNLQINPTSLMLNDYSGSRSHRNGLLYAIGEEQNVDKKLTKQEYERLEDISKEIIQQMNYQYPELKCDIDYFTMETSLCAFKKIFRVRNGRYLGYYLDRQSEEIQQVETDGWFGIDWDVLWQSRNETLDYRLSNKSYIDKEKFSEFLNYKTLSRMNWLTNKEDMKIGLEEFL